MKARPKLICAISSGAKPGNTEHEQTTCEYAILDGVRHQAYAKPFVGMGGIFLRRKMRPRAEVINDFGRDVSNLFRILQRHYPQFLEVLRFQLTTRAEFLRLAETNPNTLTDLERAARFLYLQRTAFGGKVSGRNFGVSRDRPGRFNLTTLEPMLEDLHSRLAGVVIECLDWSDFIPRYDAEGTLFYLDPPYWGCEDDYGKAMFVLASGNLALQFAAAPSRDNPCDTDLVRGAEGFDGHKPRAANCSGKRLHRAQQISDFRPVKVPEGRSEAKRRQHAKLDQRLDLQGLNPKLLRRNLADCTGPPKRPAHGRDQPP